MNDNQKIKRLIINVLKGSPFVFIILLISLYFAYKFISYKNPLYQSSIKIKLAKSTYGISATNLYKSFDVFSTEEDIQAEVITIQSQRIINEAIDKLDFGISYYRVGEIRTSDMYHETPFKVEIQDTLAKMLDLPITIKIISRTKYLLHDPFKPETKPQEYLFNKWVNLYGMEFKIIPNKDKFNKPDNVLFDKYIFKINSKESLISSVQKRLFAKEAENHVPVILVSYKDEVPLRAKIFVDTLGVTYINDYINHKSGISKKTVDFINSQLKVAQKQLEKSERALYDFRNKYKVVNTQQETETGLREISKLRIQLHNLDIESASLDTIDKYINEKGDQFINYVPKVKFGGLLYTELVKKLKANQAERDKLLSIYTPQDEKVKVINKNISEIIDYIKKSIHASRIDINQSKKRLQKIYTVTANMFENLPERKRKQDILNRQYNINQKNYIFLKQKQIEATVQSNVNMAFHRILQRAVVSKNPVYPNKVLIYFVSGLLGIILGILLLYLKGYFWAKVNNRGQIEQMSATPVAAILKRPNSYTTKDDKMDRYASLLNELIVKQLIGINNVICISSSVKNEGKTFVAGNLSLTASKRYPSTLLIDFNLYNPSILEYFGELKPINTNKNDEENLLDKNNMLGISDFIMGKCSLEDVIYQVPNSNLHVIPAGTIIQKPSEIYGHINFKDKLDFIKNKYDLVFIDSPASIITVDAIILMKLADISLFIMRSGFTPTMYIQYPDLIKEDYNINNIKIVLNSMPPTNNFSGRFISSKYNYIENPKGIKAKLYKVLEYYFVI